MDNKTSKKLAAVFAAAAKAKVSPAKQRRKEKRAVTHRDVATLSSLVTAARKDAVIVVDEKKGAVLQTDGVDLARAAMRAQLGNRTVKAVVAWSSASTTVSSVDYNTVKPLTPGSSSEWSSWSGLFDVARCLSVVVHFSVKCNASPTTDPAGVIAFDPGTSGAMPNVEAALASRYKFGPFKLSNLYNTNLPTTSTATGFFHMERSKTTPVLESGLTADLVGSAWFPVSGTNAIVGYLKPFLENPGTPTYTVRWLIEFEMEFAYRT